MIIDVHTHICSKAVRADRTPYLCPEEVCFSAIYSDPRARLSGAAELVRAMDEDGVDRSVTFGFPWVSEETARRQNDYVLEAQERFPQRLIGLACFDPLQPWAEREAVRALDAGLRGLGELAIYMAGFDQTAIERLTDLGRLCRERNVPLLVHVNEPIGHRYPGKAPLTVKMIYDLAGAAKGVKLILAHWGGGLFFYHLLKKEVSEVLTDVYFDTAASPFLYRPDIYPIADRILGPGKILFGSDFPLLKPGRYFKEIEAAGLEAESIRLIKGDAAAGIFLDESG
jgi:predicted TIM-barrel fold metal-dependent hydrolase